MVQCEMCGADTPSPKTVKIEGAELNVCDSCASFGTEVERQEQQTTSTKYSTGSSGKPSMGSSPSTGRNTQSTGGRSRRSDPFDELETLAADYNDRIRTARERLGLSQEELANQLNEKASLIRKLERGDLQPSDAIQRKLERKLDISLTESDELEDTDWEGGVSTGEFTLGDVVTRKDS